MRPDAAAGAARRRTAGGVEGVLVPAPGTARRGVGGLTKLRHESLRIKLQRGDADGPALRGRTRQQRGGGRTVARAVGWMGYAYEKNYKKSHCISALTLNSDIQTVPRAESADYQERAWH